MGSIRLFLAFAVLASHADRLDVTIVPAPVAVRSFFIISGFYMSFILAEKYAHTTIFMFYTNRLLRLFPTYLFTALASFGILYWLDVGICANSDAFQKALTENPLMAVSCLWTNIMILGQEILFVLGVHIDNYTLYWAPDGLAPVSAWHFLLVPQAWALSMELYFYLLAPHILRRRIRWVVTLFVLSLSLHFLIVSLGPQYSMFARRFFPSEFCLFLGGSLSYSLFVRIRHYRGKHLTTLISWIALAGMLVFYNELDKRYSFPLLALTFVISMPFIFGGTKNSKIDRLLGDFSYPLFIVHLLIIIVFEELFDDLPTFIMLVIIFTVALCVFYGIQVPVDRWRQRRVTQSIEPEKETSGSER